MSKIRKAQSFENGIFFYSNYIPNFGVFAYTENGEIRTKQIKEMEMEFENTFNLRTPNALQTLLIAIFIECFAIGIDIFVFHSPKITFSILAFLTFAYQPLFTLCINFYFSHIQKTSPLRKLQKFHSVEHMIINAFNLHECPPSLEELWHTSRFTQYCDGYSPIRDFIYWTIVVAFSLLSAFLGIGFYLLGLFLALFIFIQLDKRDFFKYLEVIYLVKPTELELKVAQKGLEEWIQMENELEKSGLPNLQNLHLIFYL